MVEHGVRHLPVKDGDQLVGILTDRDIKRALDPDLGLPPKEQLFVRDVFVADAFVVDSGEPLDNVLEQLAAADATLWIEPAPKRKLYDEAASKIVGGDDSAAATPAVTQQLGFQSHPRLTGEEPILRIAFRQVFAGLRGLPICVGEHDQPVHMLGALASILKLKSHSIE